MAKGKKVQLKEEQEEGAPKKQKVERNDIYNDEVKKARSFASDQYKLQEKAVTVLIHNQATTFEKKKEICNEVMSEFANNQAQLKNESKRIEIMTKKMSADLTSLKALDGEAEALQQGLEKDLQDIVQLRQKELANQLGKLKE